MRFSPNGKFLSYGRRPPVSGKIKLRKLSPSKTLTSFTLGGGDRHTLSRRRPDIMGRLHSAFGIGPTVGTTDQTSPPPQEFSRLIDQASASIADPLLKLKFIHAALDRYNQACALMSAEALSHEMCQRILVEVADRLKTGLKIRGRQAPLPVTARRPALARPPTRQARARQGAVAALLAPLLLATHATHRLQARYGVQAPSDLAAVAAPAGTGDRRPEKMAGPATGPGAGTAYTEPA